MKNKRAVSIGFLVMLFVVMHMFGHWNRIPGLNISHKLLKQSLNLRNHQPLELTLEHIKFWTDDQICKNVTFSNDLNMTSETHSKIKLVTFDKERGLCKVDITAMSLLKVPKKVGGDLFVLWAEQVNGNGRSAGDIIDNRNGTYSGTIYVYWSGETVIKAKLGSTLENYCRRKTAMIKYGNSVFALQKPWGIQGIFQNNSTIESTRCCIGKNIRGYPLYCNLTLTNDGSPWFCGKPKNPNLNCNDILEFMPGIFPKLHSDSHQDPSELISRNGQGKLKHRVIFNSTIKHVSFNSGCSGKSKQSSWFSSGGFYLNDSWSNPHCHNRMVFNIQAYRQCIINKTMVFLGDSTVRQYANFLLSKMTSLPLMDLKNLKSKNRTYHPESEFKGDGIHVIYKKHELPFYHDHIPPNGITSIARELKTLSQTNILGKNLIVVINYNSHLQAFPPDQIRTRLKSIAQSLKELLNAKPDTTVFLKGPHVHSDDHRLGLRVALVQKDLLVQEFQHLLHRIVYLDVWSISVAFNNEQLHPTGATFRSQVQQFMSYIC